MCVCVCVYIEYVTNNFKPLGLNDDTLMLKLDCLFIGIVLKVVTTVVWL